MGDWVDERAEDAEFRQAIALSLTAYAVKRFATTLGLPRRRRAESSWPRGTPRGWSCRPPPGERGVLARTVIALAIFSS